MNALQVAAILNMFGSVDAQAWRIIHNVDAPALPVGLVPLDHRGTMHELIHAGILHIEGVERQHALFLDAPDFDSRRICICGTNTYPDDAPFDAAHWMTPTSSVVAIYSCSEACGDRIEALRDEHGVLSISGLFDARGLSPDQPA